MPDKLTTLELDSYLSSSREIRRRHEGQWFVNLAYFLGHQWVQYDGRSLYEPALEPWQIKIVDNRVQPITLVAVAKMTKNRPSFVGVPATSDDTAIAAARLAERNLSEKWTTLDLQIKLRAALTWAQTCSIGYWKICWDKGAGREALVLANEQGQIVKDEYGAPMTPAKAQVIPEELRGGIQEKRIAMGEIRCDVRSPFQVFPDPLSGEEGLGSAEWVIEETVQSLDYARSRFDFDGEADTSLNEGTMEAMLPGGIGQRGAQQYRGVKIREFWAKPSSTYPRGKHIVWVGSTVLAENDLSYPWLPYVAFRGTPVPGRYYPDAPVTQLISPQTELNKRKAQIAENAARIGNPTLLVPEGLDYEYSGLPGGEMRYQNTGGPSDVPSFLQQPEVPGYIREDISRIEAALQEISGQRDVSKGMVPSGVTAASAINLLQEADDTRIGPEIADMEHTLAQAGQRIHWLTQKYYTDERMLRIAGEDGAWDIIPFRGKQLDGSDTIQVQAGSSMPRSKAAKQAAIQEILNLLLQYGMAPKERDLRRAFQEYDVGGLERLFADLGEDERQIQRENMLMASSGEPMEINSFDNDAAHVEGHEQFQKSAGYDRLPDEAKAAFEEHTAAHRFRLNPPPPPGMAVPDPNVMPGAPGAAPTGPPSGGPTGPVPSAPIQ